MFESDQLTIYNIIHTNPRQSCSFTYLTTVIFRKSWTSSNSTVDANRSSATNSSRSVNNNNSQNGGALPLYKSDSVLIESNETPRSNGEQEKVEIDIYDLDSIVISLRYYIHCLDSYDDLSYYISQKCWN